MIEKPGNDCENGAEQGSNVLKSGVTSGENSNRKEISDNKEEILSEPGTGVNSDEEEETVIQSDEKPKVLGQVECESNDDVSSQDESNIDRKEVIEKPGNDCENGAEQGSNVLKSRVTSGENSNRKEETPNSKS